VQMNQAENILFIIFGKYKKKINNNKVLVVQQKEKKIKESKVVLFNFVVLVSGV
jgi:hypothetical protein